MEHKLPQYTPVRHKKEGYEGWIDADITKDKDIFTGNKNCEFQYRIIVGDVNERRRIAPLEDLEKITSGAEFPPFLNASKKGARFRDETLLHQLGYQITDTNYVERWSILINTAIPPLGLARVIRTILDRIYQTTQGGDAAVERQRNALTEWRRDLDMLLDRFADDPTLKDKDIIRYTDEMIKILDLFAIERTYAHP
jgi:hypothetical protein